MTSVTNPHEPGAAAIATLQQMGYTHHGGIMWKPPLGVAPKRFTTGPDAATMAGWDNPEVRAIYEILCDDEIPPAGEHWEGFAARRIAALLRAGAAKVPDVLFDGYAVYKELTKTEEKRTSIENVSDVLDAVVRLMRATPPAPDAGVVEPAK